MKKQQKHYLNNQGHLTEDGLLLYIKHMDEDRVDALPEDLLNHIEQCLPCRMEMMEWYEMKQAISEDVLASTQNIFPSSPEKTQTPIQTTPEKTFKIKRYLPYLAAAGLVGLLLVYLPSFNGIKQASEPPITDISSVQEYGEQEKTIPLATNNTPSNIDKTEKEIVEKEKEDIVKPKLADASAGNAKPKTQQSKKTAKKPPSIPQEVLKNKPSPASKKVKKQTPKLEETKQPQRNVIEKGAQAIPETITAKVQTSISAEQQAAEETATVEEIEIDHLALYDEYYTPELPDMNIRSEQNSPSEHIQKAKRFYREQNFKAALTEFEAAHKLAPDNISLVYSKGICQLSADKNAAALQSFREVLRHGTNRFLEEAKWYKALIHLKENELEKAKSNLIIIQTEEGSYAKKAAELLKKL